MSKVEVGSKVRVNYTGKFEDGNIFDSSENRDPLEFTVGEGAVIPGFEEAVIGMSLGDKKSVDLPPEKAYGDHHDHMVSTVEKSQLPEHLNPGVGDVLQAPQKDGKVVIVTVIEADEDSITVDANHPLSGKALSFEIELVEIVG
ncbi:MAG: peptidylprolyl isomerase [FCB group bacterium]|nr:peptidylprolyl isomerase [FCB group bacterium]